ncbi:hypothetical protein [Nodularia spumigena]|nr:hypothetical protein [Nodularia spumigena]MDB9318246.1 hypothetical protein [Nodularia spumigena CS-590/01A]MDB9325007.1 hypothetical protein [Nodularia spumigena CS-590/02]
MKLMLDVKHIPRLNSGGFRVISRKGGLRRKYIFSVFQSFVAV